MSSAAWQWGWNDVGDSFCAWRKSFFFQLKRNLAVDRQSVNKLSTNTRGQNVFSTEPIRLGRFESPTDRKRYIMYC